MEAADSTYMLSFHQILALIFDSKKGFVVKQECSLETGFMFYSCYGQHVTALLAFKVLRRPKHSKRALPHVVVEGKSVGMKIVLTMWTYMDGKQLSR